MSSGGWSNTWKDIISGGNPRWKINNTESHNKALSHFQEYVKGEPSKISVFCPLAGDDPFVHLLFQKGYSVTTIDLVPDAVEEMKKLFSSGGNDDDDDAWKKEEKETSVNTVVWTHKSGRANLIVGDALQKRPELFEKFDAVYDKDSFGALGVDMRKGFCTRIAEYTKPGAIIYLECKLKDNHDEVKHIGPPFSLKGEDLMEASSYGDSFEYVKGLGSVYELTQSMLQTGHILKRK